MKINSIIFGILLSLGLSSCAQTDFNTYINGYYDFSVDTISTQELIKIQDRVQIIDARTSEEYSVSKIKGAHFIEYDNPKLDQLKISKKDTVVVYCTIGYRSEKIAEQLKSKGYKTVFNLYGGILKWVNDSNPVCSPTGTVTPFVHTYDKSWGKWLTNPTITAVN